MQRIDFSELESVLDEAEMRASVEGRAVLQAGRRMISQKELVIGSCWDYIDAIYRRAGYPSKRQKTLYETNEAGPYSGLSEIQPGDWLYFINHSYGDVEHSAIFVEWIDRAAGEALMLSYAGGDRQEPARYKSYELSSVYTIIRGE
ncbi:MAG: hypothetical protein H7222_05695 [Methylotenera sp.]|nr:hypothetical protein [Oligoflexia bacterium]